MNGSEMILGELKEFKRATLEELRIVRKEVRDLHSFYWRVMGGWSVLVFSFEALHIIRSL